MNVFERILAGLGITVAAVGILTTLLAIAAARLNRHADMQAIQDADEQACALTRPDDPLEQAWRLPAYVRPRTTEDTR